MITLFKNDPFFTNFLDSVFETENESLWKGNVYTHKTVNDEGVTLEFVVPGLEKEDVSIFTDDKTLRISYSPEEEKSKFVKSFERSYTMADDLDDKKINAKLENGVLTVTIPKSKKKNSQRTISVS